MIKKLDFCFLYDLPGLLTATNFKLLCAYLGKSIKNTISHSEKLLSHPGVPRKILPEKNKQSRVNYKPKIPKKVNKFPGQFYSVYY